MSVIHVGLDVGSTTIKIVIIDENDNTLFSSYQRHFSEVRKTVVDVLVEASTHFQGKKATLSVAGSGGISAAQWLGASFVQEVIAGTVAIRRFAPDTDVAIELGGEDAKLTFFDSGIDQRMNETCAGGTGAFIDQMASFLRTEPIGLNELAKAHSTIYPIAARCGVFAKTDILPLLNEGAAREDVAASIFQAVVDQTIGGLACGRAIKGKIAFLGGPLFFLSELRNRFIETLKIEPENIFSPPNAQVFVALGTALHSKKETPLPFKVWVEKAEKLLKTDLEPEINPLPELFKSLEDLQKFRRRHTANKLPRAQWPSAGGIFIGLDAGSTTTKLVALDEDCCLLHSHYGPNYGNPLKSIIKALKDLYEVMPKNLTINKVGITGYGEALIKAALGVDFGEVETVAHYKAAAFFEPNVSFIVDIGGQDMKCLSVKNGVIDKLMLNEACSSGCGSFLETFANTLELTASDFAKTALTAARPVDLGSRCTVFMNSKVKQAQKEGALVGDISAGLSYSVVRNALYKVIRINNAEELGEKVVVQGGTFFNDAVLRAFELSTGREVLRPDIAGLMGAFGAAILAQEHFLDDEERKTSTLISYEDLNKFTVETKNARCNRCSNSCLLTINKFSDNRRFISGNRCEKGALNKDQASSTVSTLPNMFNWTLERLFDYYKPLAKEKAIATVGIPRVLGFYDTYPFWFTFFTNLGFKVELSPPSSKESFNKSLETIASQTVCYPAKLVHGHILDLVEKEVDFIFYPATPYDMQPEYKTQNRYTCPLVGSYAEVIRLNMDVLKEENVPFIMPFLDLDNPSKTAKILRDSLKKYGLSSGAIKTAMNKGYSEYKNYLNDIKVEGDRVLKYVEDNKLTGVVLAGHHYHMDPEVHHGISDVIVSNNLVVLTADALLDLAPEDYQFRFIDQWASHSRLYRAALVVAKHQQLELVQLNSFGCGLDAISSDQVAEILDDAGKVFTLIKIDEGENLGAARIRIRSLLAASKSRKRSNTANFTKKTYFYEPVTLNTEKLSEFTLLCPQMAPNHWHFLEAAMRPSGYKLDVLPSVSRKAIEDGLSLVNNDACYPALVTIGQLVSALKSGKYDLNKTAVMMSQTGGACRATNYVPFLRKALEEAGLAHVPVWPFSLAQGTGNEGIQLTRGLLTRMLLGILYGDILSRLLYATRPYEVKKGSAQALFDKWVIKGQVAVENGDRKTFDKHMFEIVKDFDNLKVKNIQLPKVAIVGEVLLNYHPDANNYVVDLIEQEGGEAVLADLVDFFLYCVYDNVYKANYLTGSKVRKWVSLWLINLTERYRKSMRQALEKYPRFGALHKFSDIKKLGESIVSLGNQTGEGWYLPAGMALYLENDINNILCLQPFGCLPNHITGKGVIKELKKRYPEANLVAVDYDPGSSEVNQLNRIKLMMSVAKDNQERSSMEHMAQVREAEKLSANI